LLQHVILTRFSTKLRVNADQDGFPDGWLEQRMGLLHEYCLPGIVRQSCPDFVWLLLCDVSTDPAILKRLRDLQHVVPQLRVTMLDGDYGWRRALVDAVAPGTQVLVTTRLDSDDALHVDAVGVVQEYAGLFRVSELDHMVVNFEQGWQLDAETGVVSERWYPHSPFISLLERVGAGPIRGVMHANHTTLPTHYLTHHDLSIVGWLQVVHGGNVTNTVVDAATVVAGPDLRQFGLHR
jgi:hypothetical protein